MELPLIQMPHAMLLNKATPRRASTHVCVGPADAEGEGGEAHLRVAEEEAVVAAAHERGLAVRDEPLAHRAGLEAELVHLRVAPRRACVRCRTRERCMPGMGMWGKGAALAVVCMWVWVLSSDRWCRCVVSGGAVSLGVCGRDSVY